MSWAADVAAGTATLRVSAPDAGYVAVAWADEYNVMSPADVWAVWVDPATGAGMLSYRRNTAGYYPPSLRPLPAGAAVLAATSDAATRTLTATIVVPLPASVAAAAAAAGAPSPDAVLQGGRRRLLGETSAVGAVNMIWSTASSAPYAIDAGLDSHGSQAGVDFGAAEIDLLCAGADGCVLASGGLPAFTHLHAIALAGFLVTAGAGALANGLRRRLFALECAAQATLARTPLAPLARLLGMSSFGLPELCLVAGYFTTFGIYLAAALDADAASPARAVGALVAPLFGAALLPVTRRSLWVPLLGVSFDRAVVFHRAAANIALAVMVAHIAMMVDERGVDTMTQRTQNARGQGAVYGTAAAATFAAMALLAAPPVRQHAYELFKASHLLLLPVTMALTMLHAKLMVGYLIPPLALWALDVALRAIRAARPYPVAAVSPLPGGAVRVDVTTARKLRVAPGQYALLQLPGLAPAEWHPFTCVCAPGTPDTVSFVISGANGGASCFAARIAAAAAATSPKAGILASARLDGCFGGPALQLHRYTAVLLVAGGVGITPFASIATHLATLAHERGVLRSATLLWALRNADAADTWVPGLLPALQASPTFTVQVCITSGGGRRKHGGDADAERGCTTFTRGRPDIVAAVNAAVQAARDAGQPPSRVAVLACGPLGMLVAAEKAAAAHGAHFHAESFTL
jgi:NAD(P)H-flavin reductase